MVCADYQPPPNLFAPTNVHDGFVEEIIRFVLRQFRDRNPCSDRSLNTAAFAPVDGLHRTLGAVRPEDI
jgi:hypothetical protein